MNENNKNIVDSLSEFLNVVSVIQSQAAAVENISGASKTLNNIIRNINKFPKDLGNFDGDVVKNTLNNISVSSYVAGLSCNIFVISITGGSCFLTVTVYSLFVPSAAITVYKMGLVKSCGSPSPGRIVAP